VCPDIDLSTLRVSGLKMRMRFEIDGERRDVTVAIKVPNTVSFRDHLLEARIFEHLRLNGFLIDDDPARLAVAAVRWPPDLGQVVKLGSPARRMDPDDGQADAIFGGFQGEGGFGGVAG